MTKEQITEIMTDDEMLEVTMIVAAYDALDYVDCFPN